MRIVFIGLVLAAALGAAPARADDAAPAFDGAWHGEFTGKSGRSRQLDLDIAGGGGKLMYVRQGGKWDDACIGPELPATVAQRGAGGLTLKIDADSVIKGCGRYDFVLQPGTEPGTLVGTFSNGIVVHLKRR